jgi:hypothetical protein
MGQNDRVLLDQLLSSRHSQIAPELSESDFFELFVTDELLKNYGLSDDEIDSGLIGGGNDGGIDSMYVFIDDSLLTPDFDFDKIKEEATLNLIIIQAKRETGFKETIINNLISSMHDLLDLSNPVGNLTLKYNSQLLNIIRDYRSAIQGLAEKFPKYQFSFYYATKGNSEEVHPNVQSRVDTLKTKISDFFRRLRLSLNFWVPVTCLR